MSTDIRSTVSAPTPIVPDAARPTFPEQVATETAPAGDPAGEPAAPTAETTAAEPAPGDLPTAEPAAARPARAAASGTTWRVTKKIGASAGPVVGAFAGAIAVWYAITYLVLPEGRRFLLPPPHQVLTESVLDWSKVQPMFEALGLTAQVAMTGLAIAVVLGVGQAILMSQARWLEKSLYPYAVVLQTIPILALVPLIGLWFGFGFTSRVIVCVIIALFPMISNTLFGIQSAEPAAHDLFTLNKATRAQRLWKLQMPAAVPSMFAGLKISAGLAVIGAIVGDMFFRQGAPGIGSLLDVYRARVESENLLTAIALASLFGVVVFAVFSAIDKAVMVKWYGKR